MEEPGLNLIIKSGYQLLGLQNYFTAGPKEVRAWTIAVGVTAPKAAGVIHTDFERGFIRAEVTSFTDYIACLLYTYYAADGLIWCSPGWRRNNKTKTKNR